MQKLIKLFLTGLVLSLGTAAIAENGIVPHKAEYKVKVSVLGGKLWTELRATENGYEAQSRLRAGGLARMFVRGDVVENSTFETYAGGVRPLVYKSSDEISKHDKFMHFNFDWDQERVTGSINDQPIEMDLDGEVHDRVSLQYDLMLDLLGNRKHSQYALLDDDEMKILQVSHIGSKEIEVPYGTFDAIGIQHQKAKSSGRRITTLWCVEELGYLPILIEQHRDGKLAMRAVLTEYQPTTETTQAAVD